MRICVQTITYNEEAILPYFIKHYAKFCDKIVILDNYSTDKTVEIAKSHPKVEGDWFDTKGEFDEKINVELRSTYWKKYGDYFDWQIVVDCDEFVYLPNLLEELETYKIWGASIVPTIGYDMYADEFPHEDRFTNRQLTDIVKTGVFNKGEGKPFIFDPARIQNMQFYPGSHMCRPIGDVAIGWPVIKTLHYKHFGYKMWRDRIRVYSERLKHNENQPLGDYVRWDKNIDTEEQYKQKFFYHLAQPVI